MTRRIQLFLASSADLMDDRAAIRSGVSTWNRGFRDRQLSIDVVDSTNVLGAMSMRRSQDEINDIIEKSDVFVLLFAQTIGRFTLEEFDVALGSFKASGKPQILTFLSKVDDHGGASDAAAKEFVDLLKGLEHYWYSYSSHDQLELLVNTQLLMLDVVPRDFENLTSLTLSIDAKILEAVRDMQTLDVRTRSSVYETLIKGNLVDEHTSLSAFFPQHLRERAVEIARVLPSKVDLTIDVASTLDVVTYRAADFALDVEKPALTWNCHCGELAAVRHPDPEIQAARRATCPIHSQAEGDRLTDLYRGGVLRTTFDGIEVLWKRSPEVWPPTIDTLVMCKNLAQDGVLKRDYRTVLDLGCGTGFLGIYLAQKNPSVRELYLADWLMTPLLYGIISWEQNVREPRFRSMSPLLGLNTNWVATGAEPRRVDLCVCNPPYVPASGRFPAIRLAHTVGGTELLEHVIEKAGDIARETYVNFSDVALHEANASAERHHKELTEIGASRLVPFTVPQALKYPAYVEDLVEEGRLVRDDTSPYQWLHRIRTYRIDEAN